jgi:hypothetical protein
LRVTIGSNRQREVLGVLKDCPTFAPTMTPCDLGEESLDAKCERRA